MIGDMEFNANVVQIAVATVIVTAIGAVLRLLRMRRAEPEVAKKRRASLMSWWGVILLTLCAAILGRGFAVALFCGVSIAALREFLILRHGSFESRKAMLVAYGLIAVSYSLIWLDRPYAFTVFLPLAALLAASACMLRWAPTHQFPLALGDCYLGLLLTAYVPAFAVLLFSFPPENNSVAGGAGWFLFLMLLTEADDIGQALIGRAIGKRRIAPVISPGKTWAGFLGGVLITCVLAAMLARWLTPWHPLVAMIAGFLIAVTGFLGDLNISGIKRAAGVKDSGNLLPGQGGILDRIDSLTFAAPTFYLFVVLWSAYSRVSVE
jgi:phosphatidate cytidylyltransferase